MKHIVVATDGSPAAEAAVEDGLELARDHGSRVTFVTVRPAPCVSSGQARRSGAQDGPAGVRPVERKGR
jgi:nucleotide-binding universal stress UspA family protein